MTALCPMNKLPNRQEATMLIVGPEGMGKHALSQTVISFPSPFSLKIHTATKLPLPSENDAARPRIDFICFIVDVRNKESVQVLESSLKHVDKKYFLGKSCLLATGNKWPEKVTVEQEPLLQLVDRHHLSTVYGEVSTEEERRNVAQRLLKMVETAAGLKPYVTPLLLGATQWSLHLNQE